MNNLWARFDQVVGENSARAALVFAGRQTSYGDLKRAAERAAGILAGLGATRGTVVALQLFKRVETYALILACLRLGVPYVLLDPKNPDERTRRIVDRVRPVVLFTHGAAKNPHGRVITIAPEAIDFLDGLPASQVPPPANVTGIEPAYIMFTSGSTGEPKGAVIPHQGVISLMRWARRSVISGRDLRFTALNPLHFDNSVFDLYCGLLNGCGLVPVETGEQVNFGAWCRTIRDGNANVMFAVPTLFMMLDDVGLLTPQSLPTIRTFIFGGEGYPLERLKPFHARFRDAAGLLNVYGPTETSCISTSVKIDDAIFAMADKGFPPLGRMHQDFSHSLRDPDGNAVAAGQAGELWIGGPCVGLGYWNNARETVLKFVQDPAEVSYRALYYRSGDLVREAEDGMLWFLGRVDNQVKIRGHRIELEEIDMAVQALSGVRRAVAVLVSDGDAGILKVAFTADRIVGSDEVTSHCQTLLPTYMRPNLFVQVDDLPLNSSGKVDRLAAKALLAAAQTSPEVLP